MRYKEIGDSEWAAFLEEQTQRCLTLQLLMPSHSNQLRVEVEGETHNTKGIEGVSLFEVDGDTLLKELSVGLYKVERNHTTLKVLRVLSAL